MKKDSFICVCHGGMMILIRVRGTVISHFMPVKTSERDVWRFV